MYNVCKSLWTARLNPKLFYDVLMHWCRAVFISAAFICTCPPRLSLILSSSRRGGGTHQLMFFLHCDWLIQSCFDKLWAPLSPHRSSSLHLCPVFLSPLRESCLFASLAFFFFFYFFKVIYVGECWIDALLTQKGGKCDCFSSEGL